MSTNNLLGFDFKPKQESNTVVFANVSPDIRAYFSKFSRGQGDQKTSVFETAFRALLEKEGYDLNADGVLIGKTQTVLALDEQPKGDAEISDESKPLKTKG